jgi:lipopolysaccharide export system protein LptA
LIVRLTIEWLRTVVLAAGVLLVVALGVFLALGKWKNPFKNRDIPKRLGIDITQESNGVTYTQSRGGRTFFTLHASKLVQLKSNHALLHDVVIEFYGADGSRTDRIAGSEFEYDQQTQVAQAAGPVEITMMRPRSAPGQAKTGAPAAKAPAADEIHVRTSGLAFDRKTGVATTNQHVDFSLTQGAGSSQGATYDSTEGHLVLSSEVELNVKRNGETVLVHALHAEFDRDQRTCDLRSATADYHDGKASAGAATILFRSDGSAERMDAKDGFALTTANGGHVAAPVGWLEFNEKNQPQRGYLEGGVTMDAATQADKSERQSHGSSPTAALEFSADGELRHAHLERGVELTSEEHSNEQSGPQAVSRTWKSPVADVEFRQVADSDQVEPEWIHGVEGVVITGVTQHGNGTPLPSRLAADDMTANFGPHATISDLKGVGHASIAETTAAGARQTSSGDRLEARFVQERTNGDAAGGNANKDGQHGGAGAAQIEAAVLEGHVTMTQQPAAKPGSGPADASTAAPAMRATAGRADYAGAGEWVHLTESPWVDDGGLQLAADKIDVSQASGDAFAHGDVKATWLNQGTEAASPQGKARSGAANRTAAGFGGQGPSHVIADEAQMNRARGEATFRGNARLWQDANSVAAPVIVLSQLKQTLLATSTDAKTPVRVVMVGTSVAEPGAKSSNRSESKKEDPEVTRVSGGSLRYSDAEHKALMVAGNAGRVVVETATARTVADEVELFLMLPENHAGKNGGSAQVDKMTARGHVVVTSQGRRGTGTQLLYSSESGNYVLTGTAGEQPRMTDPVRGTVTGEALIFHSRDDSVSIEGGAGETATDTRTPK